MMSSEQIEREAERHARKAKRHGKVPHFLSALGDDAIRRECARIPFLGDYVPRGFERMHVGDTFGEQYGAGTADHAYLFVDSSGSGERGERAMTIGQFAEFVQRHPGYGYAIVEAGQFQIVLGVYQVKAARGTHTKLTGKLARDFHTELSSNPHTPEGQDNPTHRAFSEGKTR